MSHIMIGNDSVAMATCDIDRTTLFAVAKDMVQALFDQRYLRVTVNLPDIQLDFDVGGKDLKKRNLLSILGRQVKQEI